MQYHSRRTQRYSLGQLFTFSPLARASGELFVILWWEFCWRIPISRSLLFLWVLLLSLTFVQSSLAFFKLALIFPLYFAALQSLELLSRLSLALVGRLISPRFSGASVSDKVDDVLCSENRCLLESICL